MWGKLFASTYTGSMFGAGEHVFSVWTWCIANAGAKGVLEINPAMVAAMLGTTPDRISRAIEYLCAPDPASRSEECDGARLAHESGIQYRIVNHSAYRSIRDEDERREYNRRKKQESRARQSCQTVSNDVSNMSAHTEDRRQKTEPEFSLVGDADPAPPKADTSKRKRKADTGPVVDTYPLRNGNEWQLRESLVESLRDAYPRVDVPSELKRAKLWLIANPKRQKTAGGMAQMLTGWVSRSHDRVEQNTGVAANGNGPADWSGVL